MTPMKKSPFSKGMDDHLYERLKKIEEQVERLEKIEKQYLYLDAHKKIMFSSLFLEAEGKSVAEREAFVYASDKWKNFIDGAVEAETQYLREKRLLELKLKAYDAAHLTFKVEGAAIKRQGETT